MVAIEEAALAAGALLMVAGFLYAAVADLKDREVSDALWQVLGPAGFALGLVGVVPGGVLPAILWVAVGILTLEHMFAWDDRFGPTVARYADLVEIVGYAVVISLLAGVVFRYGLGSNAGPVPVVAVLVSVVFARVLFEAGVLYGGADAKALMIAAILVPMFPEPLLFGGGRLLSVPTFLPFAIDLLMNAALLSLVVPVGIGLRNMVRGDFSFPRGFTGFRLSVAELPSRFVWVRDPLLPSSQEAEEEIESSEEDARHRTRIAKELEARGVESVWVTPQVPFLVLMAAGAIAALVGGNLLVDLLQWL